MIPCSTYASIRPHRFEQLPQAAGLIVARATTSAAAVAGSIIIEWTIAREGAVDGEGGIVKLGTTMAARAAGGEGGWAGGVATTASRGLIAKANTIITAATTMWAGKTIARRVESRR